MKWHVRLVFKFWIVLETCSFMSAVPEKRHESWWIQMSWCFMHVIIWMALWSKCTWHFARKNESETPKVLRRWTAPPRFSVDFCRFLWTKRHQKLLNITFTSITVQSIKNCPNPSWNTVFDVNVSYECSWESGCPLTVHAARVWPAPLTQTIPVERLSCGLGKPCLRGSKSFSLDSFSCINSLTTH